MIKRRILLIDDEQSFTAMLKLNLESTGEFIVCVENNPKFAISTASEFSPDLILLDVIMPVIEGPDIAHELKNDEHLQATPVIFLTATVTKDEVESHNGTIGGHRFVAKPSNLSYLLTVINQSLINA